jgi:hypothetical protein
MYAVKAGRESGELCDKSFVYDGIREGDRGI